MVNGTRLDVAVSIGVAPRQPDTTGPAELLRQADFAMYMAEGNGKNRYQLFDPQQHSHMATTPPSGPTAPRPWLLTRQLDLDCQPVADLRTGRILGIEAFPPPERPFFTALAGGRQLGLEGARRGAGLLSRCGREGQALDRFDGSWCQLTGAASRVGDAPWRLGSAAMTFAEAMEHVAQLFEGIGAFVLLGGLFVSVGIAVRSLSRSRDARLAYRALRESFGGVILLGLEILVAADLVRTVAVAPTLRNVMTLGLIVLIRTFLSFSLEIEIEGVAPWRRAATSGATHIARAARLGDESPGPAR